MQRIHNLMTRCSLNIYLVTASAVTAVTGHSWAADSDATAAAPTGHDFDMGDRPRVKLLVPLLVVAVAVLAAIWGGLGSLRVPVVVYVAVIVAMWWTAITRWWTQGSRSAALAAAGATAFVVSDGLLALNRFREPFPAAALLVLGPYYLAQFLLAASAGSGAGDGTPVEAT